MITEIVAYGAVAVVKWLVYTGLVWFMLKIQKLNYTWLGLFGSTGAAALCGFIPYFGDYIGYAVLLFCLWRCTKADLFPDVVFTVVVAGALMFAVNLFALGALMGSLRPGLSAEEETDGRIGMMDSFNASDQLAGTLAERGDEAAGEDPTNPVRGPERSLVPARATTVQAREVNLPGDLALKGVSLTAPRPLAMINFGRQMHTVTTGETIKATVLQNVTQVRCDEINRTSVVVTIDFTNRIRLMRR